MSSKDIEDPDWWVNKGNSLYELDKFEEALKAFNQAIGIEPQNVNAWVGKGSVLHNLERYEEALEALSKAIEIEPKNEDIWINKGIILSSLKRDEEAVDAYNKAIEVNPQNEDLWISKGNILGYLSKYQDALEAFNKAIDIEPKNKDAWTGKGYALNDLERYEDALEAFNKAVEIEPKNANLWISKGNLFLNLKVYSYALKAYERAINFESENALAWKSKGIALLSLEKYAECQKALEQALNLDPKNAEVCSILAEYYLRFGDIKNAYKYTESSLLINKESAISLGLKGKIKIEEHDYSTSTKCFNKAISSDLRNPVYLLWDSYAKYLMAELELASDEKKYQDMILAIIRELEKVDKFDSLECNNNSKVILSWFFKIIPCWFKNLTRNVLKSIKRTLIYFNISEELTVRSVETINKLLVKLESTKIIAYNYYFLGCFYYKINDYFMAIEYLKECNNLNPDPTIKRPCREILNNIWNNKIKPSIWGWWLNSPLNRWFKRVSFLILILSLFGILLPSQAYELSGISFFSSIDWKENTTPLTFLTLIILFILASPNIQRFKSSQIEIEVRPPPAFELTPSLIEKKLKDLESISRP